MGRRRSTFDDLILLPWPVCLMIGMAGYVALRYGVGWYFSSREGAFTQSLVNAAAGGTFAPLAWMFLALCCIAALISFLRARSRRRLLDQTQQLDDLRTIP